MSTERDELAEKILYHPWLPDHQGLYTGLCPSCPDLKMNGGHNSPSHADHLADAILAAGYRKPKQITIVEELDALPLRSIVALISHSRNVPMVIVFQRGSIEFGGDGWCTPEAIGQIPSEAVFEFIALNGYPTVFTVLHVGGAE